MLLRGTHTLLPHATPTTGTRDAVLEYAQLDISQPASVEAFAAWLKAHGRLDILVNNAGGCGWWVGVGCHPRGCRAGVSAHSLPVACQD
jgi:NAD(P)-dependent dehydrogenase (short-subunit alcohol dehydrogenase family)